MSRKGTRKRKLRHKITAPGGVRDQELKKGNKLTLNGYYTLHYSRSPRRLNGREYKLYKKGLIDHDKFFNT